MPYKMDTSVVVLVVSVATFVRKMSMNVMRSLTCVKMKGSVKTPLEIIGKHLINMKSKKIRLIKN